MTFKKTVAIAAAAGALAAISVPAMAFDNEFHGTYTFNTLFSNFQTGASGDFTPTTGKENRQMNNYLEQRARLQYIAKASDDLKLVTHFELDTRFGSPAQNGAANGTGTNPATSKYTSTDAGRLDADGISLETKHVYLDFNLGSNFNVKTGIQPYKDTIKGLFIDADVPAVITTTKMGAYTLGVGFSRFADDAGTVGATATTRLGGADKDLFILDNTIAFNKDTKAALSYYFLADYSGGATGGAATLLDTHSNTQAVLLSTLGLSGETKLGGLSLSGFAAMQAGSQKNFVGAASRYFHGYAANVAAKMAVGPGTAKTAFLFTSGDNSKNNGSYKGWVTSSVNTYNESGMMILARNTLNSPTSTDQYIRRNVTNIALLTMGYDANLTDKIYANGNVGFGWAPASKGAPTAPGAASYNGSDLLGAELNVEGGYKVNPNLTLRAQAAYMMLGGYYNNAASNSAVGALKDPENPYTMRLLASFKF